MTPVQLHRLRADAFGRLIDGVTDWSAPAPVPEWTARDVVAHLIDWSADFVTGRLGISLPAVTPVEEDPRRAWAEHVARIEHLLESRGSEVVTAAPMGTQPLGQMLDRIYTPDIFLHSWDLARASGQEPPMDEPTCEAMLAGMEPMDELLRSSGQYGPRVPVAPSRSALDRLIGFIGRDPDWSSDLASLDLAEPNPTD